MNSNSGRERSLSERTLSGLGWSYLSTFIKALLSLLVLVILARLLTPVDFGLQGIAWIFILLGARFGQSVVGPAIVQRYALTDRHIQVGFTLSVASGIAIMPIIWLGAPLVGEFFNEPRAARVLQVLSVIVVINGIGVVPVHLLRRKLHFRQLMVADILAYSVGYGLTAVVLAFQGFGVWSLVWGEIMYKVIHTATATWYSPQRLRPGWGRRDGADLLSTGAGFSLARMFEFIARQGAYFIIGRWLGAASLGYYSRADRLIVLPKNYVSQSLLDVLFPAMARRQRGADRLATIYLHGIETLALVALPLSVMVFMCAPEIVSVILGGQWDPVVVVLRILAVAVLFQMCDILNVAAIGALGAVYRQAWRQGVHAFLVVVGAWYASRWGLGGVAVAMVGAQAAAYLLQTQLTMSLLQVRPRQFFRCYLPALWAGAWATVALWVIADQVRAMALPVGLTLFIEGLVWLAAVIAALYYAPSFVRPVSIHWAMTNMPFEVLGTTGRYLRMVLTWLEKRGQTTF